VSEQGPTPPGWYPDPSGGLRWYDGMNWTDQVRAYQTPDTPPPPPRGGPGRGLVVAIVVAAVLLVAGGATALVLALGSDDGDEGAEGDPSTTITDESSDQPTDEPTGEPTDEPTEPTEPTEPAEDGPADVVQGFLEAALRGDCAEAESFVTADLIRREGGCNTENLGGDTDGIDFEVGEPSVQVDTATVPVTMFLPGSAPVDPDDQPQPDSEYTLELGLVAQGNTWKIDDFGVQEDVR
jgi:hypothetical protein